MFRPSSLYVCILLLGACYLDVRATQIQDTPQTRAQSEVPRAVIDKYCVGCHNERLKTAGLVLENADLDHAGARAELWEKVLRKLRAREMPPLGRPRPDAATYTAMTAVLEKTLDD